MASFPHIYSDTQHIHHSSMSTSPCCAEYKFPASSPNTQNEGFSFGRPIATGGYNVTGPAKEVDDYFAIKPPSTQLQRTTYFLPKNPGSRAQASGSVSSLGSDATFTETLNPTIGHDFNMSTDTLFEDCELETGPSTKAPRNVLLLSLNMPKKGLHHKARSSVGSTTGLLARQAMARDAEIGEDSTSSLSAVEPRFQLDRKYSLGMAEEALARSQPLMGVPTLKKQLTLPNLTPTREGMFLDTIKNEQLKRLQYVAPQEDFRDAISKLSPTISYHPPAEIVAVLSQSHILPETGLRDVLVLDIRPLADHVKLHLQGAINICLPLTLLKRASFDFKRCVNSLPAYEKLILQNYFYHNTLNFKNNAVSSNPRTGAHGFPAIVLYDHSNTSLGIYHMCRKLIDHSCFDAASAPPIYLLNAPFLDLVEAYPNCLASGKTESIDVTTLAIQDPLDETKTNISGPKFGGGLSRACPPASINILKPVISGLATPTVSNFSLPSNLPETKFKIRHNEEMFDFSTAPSTDDKLSHITVSSPGLRQLPQWLKESVANNTRIRADFNKLEECEKSRLNSALKIRLQHEFTTPGGNVEATPVINSGLDYGHKNRYKDIFLYEHSRVSLNDSTAEKQACMGHGLGSRGCDYINASYLRSSESVFQSILGTSVVNKQLLKYTNSIATQGPLMRTAGDFWKCVAYQGSLVIVSLTNDVENGVEKCFAFWKSGKYMSGSNVVDVALVDTEKFGALTLRTFSINIDNKIHHKVMQLHLDSWMDMGVAMDSNEVLAMIHLKNHILSNSPRLPEYPTIIHCSAGCGRTGVFAATDMLMNAFKFKGNNFDVSTDPIYEIVNDLRRQRILMVQTVRQYSSIYSLLIHRIVGLEEWLSITGTHIAKAFLGL